MADKKKSVSGRAGQLAPGRPELMLLFIVYSNAVDEEITETVKRHAGGYTKFTGVYGEGSREPHLGSHIWPSMNNCVMAAIDASQKSAMTQDIMHLKEKFSGVGISLFITRLDEML